MRYFNLLTIVALSAVFGLLFVGAVVATDNTSMHDHLNTMENYDMHEMMHHTMHGSDNHECPMDDHDSEGHICPMMDNH